MFFASKILALITQPLLWVFALLLLSLWVGRRKPRTAARLVGLSLLLMVLISWVPLSDMLTRTLESQYPEFAPQADLSGYVGVVVLGGATESGRTQMAHVQPMMNDAAERMTAPVALLRRNPKLRLLYTGGEGSLMGIGMSEAERAKMFLTAWA